MPNWAERWAGHDRTMNAGAPRSANATPMPTVRNANPVTGFDPEDDIPLSSAEHDRRTSKSGPRTYWGPHLLINTTLNLVAGKDLAWRDRKGESFTLSPLYCGSKSVTGYARLGPRRRGVARAASTSRSAGRWRSRARRSTRT